MLPSFSVRECEIGGCGGWVRGLCLVELGEGRGWVELLECWGEGRVSVMNFFFGMQFLFFVWFVGGLGWDVGNGCVHAGSSCVSSVLGGGEEGGGVLMEGMCWGGWGRRLWFGK